MAKVTVCLITPPSLFLLDERVFVSLGILKVASSLEAAGHAVELVDLSGVSNFEDAIRQHALASDAAAYALTATTPQLPAAAKLSAAIRAVRPEAKIIIGGPHPTVTLAAVKKQGAGGRAQRALDQLHTLFDVVVAGDGEDAIFQALAMSRGLVDADDPKGPLFLTNKRLEATPMPARHLVDMASYHYKIDGVPATTLIAQLGCPFMCTFCSGRSSPMLRRIRSRSTASVLAELEHLYLTYGYRGYMMYDDELNVSKSLVELMRGIAALAKRLGTEFRLRGFVKAELFTQEQAYAMYEAGFRWLLCGFESAHPRILQNIEKKATVYDNDNMLTFARAAGLKVKALMSLGHAGESAETIQATEDWLISRHVDDFDATVITPYPGSPYYDEAVDSGMRVPRGGACGVQIPNVNGHGPDERCLRPNGHGPFPGLTNSGEDHYRYTQPEDPTDRVWTYSHPKTGDRLHSVELDYATTTDFYKGVPGEYRAYTFTDHLTGEQLVKMREDLEARVRAALGIPYNAGAPGIQFEASMGQTKELPSTILRRSA